MHLGALLEALGAQRDQARPLLGHELGAPRDYRWNGLAYVFNTKGAQRLARLLEIEGVEVVATHPDDEPLETSSPSTTPWRHRRGDRANGYQPEPES